MEDRFKDQCKFVNYLEGILFVNSKNWSLKKITLILKKLLIEDTDWPLSNQPIMKKFKNHFRAIRNNTQLFQTNVKPEKLKSFTSTKIIIFKFIHY